MKIGRFFTRMTAMIMYVTDGRRRRKVSENDF